MRRVAALGVLVLGLAGTAAAAASPTGSIHLDGVACLGCTVDFAVATSRTPEPYVRVVCSQDGQVVYRQTKGLFAGFYDPDHSFTLGPTEAWTSGSADCTASVLELRNGSLRTLPRLAVDFTALG
jgi:hypothetical protein